MKSRTLLAFAITASVSLLAVGATAQTLDDLAAASKAEESVLRIYSNMGPDNWAPIKAAFEEKYPWITVETLDLGGSEMFTRYGAEIGTGAPSADFMVTASPAGWLDFYNAGNIMPYDAPMAEGLPEWSNPLDGLYTFSTDPILLGYNKLLVPEERRVSTLAELAEVVVEDPAMFKGRIGSYDGTQPFGGDIFWAVHRERGEAFWDWMEAIGPNVGGYSGSGGMIEKMLSGENTTALFLSSTTLFPKLGGPVEDVIVWTYITDGQPIFIRGMAIPVAAENDNAAKLMLNFLLSREGQIKVAEGGFTPYHPELTPSNVPRETLSSVIEKIGGADNLVLINYDNEQLTGFEAFADRLNQAFQR
jgi:iron(III) transport system substrate-binding protein